MFGMTLPPALSALHLSFPAAVASAFRETLSRPPDNCFDFSFPLQFLTLCVTSQPRCYPDHQRLAILALLCRVSLDRNLRKQPLIDLQQLLLVLLEGIQKWEETVRATEPSCHFCFLLSPPIAASSGGGTGVQVARLA